MGPFVLARDAGRYSATIPGTLVKGDKPRLGAAGDVGLYGSSDPRLKSTKKYLTLKQDPNNSNAQKLGTFNVDTWAAYLLNGEAFVKRTKADPAKTYPDFGCSFETFTNNDFLEIETLGPMTKVQPEQTVEQVEHWGLYKNVKPAAITDEELTRVLGPILQ